MSVSLDEIEKALEGEIVPVDGRAVLHPERKNYDIKQLWERHHEIMNLHSLGHSNKDIAEILGCSEGTVSNTINSSLGKIREAELREIRNGENAVRLKQIQILTDKSLAKYYEILESEHATLKEQKEVADVVVKELSGLRKPLEVNSRSASLLLTPEDLKTFKDRGIANMIDQGLAVPSEE